MTQLLQLDTVIPAKSKRALMESPGSEERYFPTHGDHAPMPTEFCECK